MSRVTVPWSQVLTVWLGPLLIISLIHIKLTPSPILFSKHRYVRFMVQVYFNQLNWFILTSRFYDSLVGRLGNLKLSFKCIIKIKDKIFLP